MDVQRLVEAAQGKDSEALVNQLALRSMQKARYAPEPLGHFGLAAADYCHFTSPIRRYPDLIGHRILHLLLDGRMDARCRAAYQLLLGGVCKANSESERTAMEAERAIDDKKKAEYMEREIGHSFTGVISSVTGFGFFVSLPNTAEGLVRFSTMDEYFYYDAEKYRLINKRGDRVYRLGDRVAITVKDVDVMAGTIDFVLKNGYDTTRLYTISEQGKERPHAKGKGNQGHRPKQKGKA